MLHSDVICSISNNDRAPWGHEGNKRKLFRLILHWQNKCNLLETALAYTVTHRYTVMQIQLSEDCWFMWLQLYSFQNKDCGLGTPGGEKGEVCLPPGFLKSFHLSFFFLPNLTKHQHIWFTAGHEVTLRYTVFSSLTWPRIMTAFIKYWSSLCFLCNLRHNKKKTHNSSHRPHR